MARCTADLPIHFHTGLRAIGIVNGRPVWPIIGGSEPPAPPAPPPPPSPPVPAPPPAPPAPPSPPTDPAEKFDFPANTSIAEMTPAQQTEYWRHKARVHEDRNKAYGGLTAEQLSELREKADKHDALERELMSDKDKAVAEAADAAKASTRAELIPELVQAKFESAAAGRLTSEQIKAILAPLDKTYFTDAAGKVDTAKVTAYVEQVAPAKGNPDRKGPGVTPHAPAGGSGAAQLSSLSGSELYDRLHPKKTA